MEVRQGVRVATIVIAAIAALAAPALPAEQTKTTPVLASVERYEGDPVTFLSRDKAAVERLRVWTRGFLGMKEEPQRGFVLTGDQIQEAVALSNERKDTAKNNLLVAFLARFSLVTGAPGAWELKPAAISSGVVVSTGNPMALREQLAREGRSIATR